MIENEHQYKITSEQAEKFQQAIARLKEQPVPHDKTDAYFHELQIQALASCLQDLEDEMFVYGINSSFSHILNDITLPQVGKIQISCIKVNSVSQLANCVDALLLYQENNPEQVSMTQPTDYRIGRVVEVTTYNPGRKPFRKQGYALEIEYSEVSGASETGVTGKSTKIKHHHIELTEDLLESGAVRLYLLPQPSNQSQGEVV